MPQSSARKQKLFDFIWQAAIDCRPPPALADMDSDEQAFYDEALRIHRHQFVTRFTHLPRLAGEHHLVIPRWEDRLISQAD